jgi:hypothetical protein
VGIGCRAQSFTKSSRTSDAKVEAVEKEAAAVPALKMKHVVPAEPTGKAPVFEWMIEMC